MPFPPSFNSRLMKGRNENPTRWTNAIHGLRQQWAKNCRAHAAKGRVSKGIANGPQLGTVDSASGPPIRRINFCSAIAVGGGMEETAGFRIALNATAGSSLAALLF